VLFSFTCIHKLRHSTSSTIFPFQIPKSEVDTELLQDATRKENAAASVSTKDGSGSKVSAS